jgi:predicted cation transporter
MKCDESKHVRIPTSLEVYWQKPSHEPMAKLTSLGIYGCLIETTVTAAIGELLEFELVLPIGKRLPLQGRVMYQCPAVGFGMLFTPLSEEQHDSLSQVIETTLLSSDASARQLASALAPTA